MHITLKRTALLHALELIGRISTKHITNPLLQCVLLKVQDGELVATATNLEIGISVPVAAASEALEVAVPATTLLQVVNLMSDRSITLTLEGDVLVVEGQRSQTNVKTFPVDEFPTIPQVTTDTRDLQSAQFALGIKSTAFACSVSSIKPELGSINIFQKKEHSLTFVATDSFRLMEKTVAQKGVVLEDGLLVPQKNALELARILETEEVPAKLQVDESQCALRFENGVYVTSRLTSGTFPDYEQIIPKEYSTHVTLLKQDLLQAFKRTNIFLNRFQQVQIVVTEAGLTVSANSGDVGTTTESVTAQMSGDELSLNFNQRYVNEALPHFSDESIELHFAGIGRPLVITGVHDTSVRYLVMPMNK